VVFDQKASVETDFLFVIEKSEAGHLDPGTSNEITCQFMDLYQITFSVPSINLFAICGDDSPNSLLSKFVQMIQNSFILSTYPYEFLSNRYKFNPKSNRLQHIYQDFPQSLTLVTNGTV